MTEEEDRGLRPADTEDGDGRIVDPEIMGYEAPQPLLKRLLKRTALVLVLAGLGALLVVVGTVLILTIFGAYLGLPLLLLGLLLLLTAGLLPFARD